jgi:hypothetical protein
MSKPREKTEMTELEWLCYAIFSEQSDDADFCKLADNILQKYKNNLLQIPLDSEEYILPNSPPEPAEEEENNPEPEEVEVDKEEPREQVEGPQNGDAMYEDISSASDTESEPDGRSYQMVRLCKSCQEPMEMAEVPEKLKVRIFFNLRSP